MSRRHAPARHARTHAAKRAALRRAEGSPGPSKRVARPAPSDAEPTEPSPQSSDLDGSCPDVDQPFFLRATLRNNFSDAELKRVIHEGPREHTLLEKPFKSWANVDPSSDERTHTLIGIRAKGDFSRFAIPFRFMPALERLKWLDSPLLDTMLRDNPLMTKLVVRGSSHLTAEAVDSMPRLQHLDMAGCPGVDLSKMRSLPELRYLAVRGCKNVTLAAVRRVMGTKHINIKTEGDGTIVSATLATGPRRA